MLLDYQGLKLHPAFVSLTAVLSGAIDPHVFQGKVVLIGVMAESVPDLFQTPTQSWADEPTHESWGRTACPAGQPAHTREPRGPSPPGDPARVAGGQLDALVGRAREPEQSMGSGARARGTPQHLRPGRPEQPDPGPVPPQVVGTPPPSRVGVGALLHGDDRVWSPPRTAEGVAELLMHCPILP